MIRFDQIMAKTRKSRYTECRMCKEHNMGNLTFKILSFAVLIFACSYISIGYLNTVQSIPVYLFCVLCSYYLFDGSKVLNSLAEYCVNSSLFRSISIGKGSESATNVPINSSIPSIVSVNSKIPFSMPNARTPCSELQNVQKKHENSTTTVASPFQNLVEISTPNRSVRSIGKGCEPSTNVVRISSSIPSITSVNSKLPFRPSMPNIRTPSSEVQNVQKEPKNPTTTAESPFQSLVDILTPDRRTKRTRDENSESEDTVKKTKYEEDRSIARLLSYTSSMSVLVPFKTHDDDNNNNDNKKASKKRKAERRVGSPETHGRQKKLRAEKPDRKRSLSTRWDNEEAVKVKRTRDVGTDPSLDDAVTQTEPNIIKEQEPVHIVTENGEHLIKVARGRILNRVNNNVYVRRKVVEEQSPFQLATCKPGLSTALVDRNDKSKEALQENAMNMLLAGDIENAMSLLIEQGGEDQLSEVKKSLHFLREQADSNTGIDEVDELSSPEKILETTELPETSQLSSPFSLGRQSQTQIEQKTSQSQATSIVQSESVVSTSETQFSQKIVESEKTPVFGSLVSGMLSLECQTNGVGVNATKSSPLSNEGQIQQPINAQNSQQQPIKGGFAFGVMSNQDAPNFGPSAPSQIVSSTPLKPFVFGQNDIGNVQQQDQNFGFRQTATNQQQGAQSFVFGASDQQQQQAPVFKFSSVQQPQATFNAIGTFGNQPEQNKGGFSYNFTGQPAQGVFAFGQNAPNQGIQFNTGVRVPEFNIGSNRGSQSTSSALSSSVYRRRARRNR